MFSPAFDAIHIAVAAGALTLAVFLVFHFVVRRPAAAAVRSRAPLSAEQFAALFESERERALAAATRECLRRHIPVDVALVRPDDRLCEDLQLGAADGLDVNEFVIEVETMAGVKIPEKDAARMRTLREIVSYVAARSSADAVNPYEPPRSPVGHGAPAPSWIWTPILFVVAGVIAILPAFLITAMFVVILVAPKSA